MMPRVITVINQYWPFEGGAESLSRFVVEQTNASGVTNNVLTIRKKVIEDMAGRSLPKREEVNDYCIYRFPLVKLLGKEKNGKIFRYVTLLKFIYHLILLRNKYDIIHAHTFYWSTSACIITGKLLGKPVIVTGHSTLTMLVDEITKGPQPSFLLSLLKYADKYVAINESICTETATIANIPNEKVTVIHNGININTYRPTEDNIQKNNLRRQLGLPIDCPLIIYHGRLEDYKNIQTLLRALHDIGPKDNNFILLLLGDGPYKANLLDLTNQYELMDNVQFLGFRHNVEDYLRAADIYCLPSFIEGLSLALLEAMASGLTCIASEINGNKALITEGKNGFLFAPSQHLQLGNIILSQLNSLETNYTLALKKAARKRIVEHFSLEIMTKKYVQLYKKVWQEIQQR